MGIGTGEGGGGGGIGGKIAASRPGQTLEDAHNCRPALWTCGCKRERQPT